MRVCCLTSGRQFTTSALGIYSTQRLAKRKEHLLPLVLVCCPLLRRVHASLCLGNHLVHLPRGSGPGNIFSSSTRAASVSSPPVSWEQGRTEPPVQLALDGGDVAAVGDQGDEDGAVEVEGEIIAAVEVEAKALSAKRAFKICPVCDQKIDKKIPQENLLIYRQSKDLPGEAQVPGSVSNVKRAFSHTQADKEGHNFYANENLLKVDCRSPL